jgi:hypothetical protein
MQSRAFVIVFKQSARCSSQLTLPCLPWHVGAACSEPHTVSAHFFVYGHASSHGCLLKCSILSCADSCRVPVQPACPAILHSACKKWLTDHSISMPTAGKFKHMLPVCVLPAVLPAGTAARSAKLRTGPGTRWHASGCKLWRLLTRVASKHTLE